MKYYKRKITPPHLEKAVQIINGLRILQREGIIHLNSISFDEEIIEKLEMMNPDRSRTRQMLLISEAAKELASEHQGTDKPAQLKRIPQCSRPTPEKYLHATEVFQRFLEKERLVSGPLKNYLELSDEDVSEEKRILEKRLFKLGFTSEDLKIFGSEGPMTQYSANVYHSKPVFNPLEGLVGLSYSLKASACSIIQSPIYNDSKTEKAKMVYDAALELTELVKRYHLSNAKAA